MINICVVAIVLAAVSAVILAVGLFWVFNFLKRTEKRIEQCFEQAVEEVVENCAAELKAVTAGYRRFVPQEILAALEKDDIRHVNAGDFIEKRGIILMLSVGNIGAPRGEIIKRLNRFYAQIMPVLDGKGVVERFNVREMRAFLDVPPNDAADTAIKMLARINTLNDEFAEEDQKAVECGILLAQADLMLGVAGDDARLNVMLFSRFFQKTDDIRAAKTLYGCRLMVEQSLYDELADKHTYRHRLLGSILDGGEKRNVYDFYDSDNAEVIQGKNFTKETFEKAVDHYNNARYTEARAAFLEILKRRQDDPASREYLKKSHARLESTKLPDVLFTV